MVVILFAFFLCGCGMCGDTLVPCSDENRTCFELVTETIPFSELKDIVEREKTIELINKRVPVLCLREQGASYCATYKISDSEWGLVYFDSERVFQSICQIKMSDSIMEKDFDTIKDGSNISDVKKIDPDGDYDFMYASWSGYPQCSYHYTNDGYKIVISYDTKYNVIDVDKYKL